MSCFSSKKRTECFKISLPPKSSFIYSLNILLNVSCVQGVMLCSTEYNPEESKVDLPFKKLTVSRSFTKHLNVSWSFWAPITRLDGLNNKYLFIEVLEAWRSRMKVLADPGSGEDTLSGSYLVPWQHSHGAVGARELLGVLYKGMNPFLKGSTS